MCVVRCLPFVGRLLVIVGLRFVCLLAACRCLSFVVRLLVGGSLTFDVVSLVGCVMCAACWCAYCCVLFVGCRLLFVGRVFVVGSSFVCRLFVV